MTTKVDLLLLGLLLDKPMHGYEISQLMKAEQIDAWCDISMASIYYSLNKLRKKDWISETRQRGSGGPEKGVYRLTEAGRAQFFTAMEESLATEETVYFDFDLSIYLLNRLPRHNALEFLARRREALRTWQASVQEWQAQAADSLPLKQAVFDHIGAFGEMESTWLDGFINRIRGDDESRSVVEMDSHALMNLSGDLRDFHFPDLVRLVASGRLTGTLAVSDGRAVRSISFRDGQPACVWSQQVVEASDSATLDAGQVRELMLSDLYDLFRWQEGKFVFDQQGREQAACVSLDVTIDELILEGTRWVDNWATIQRFVPSADTIFELHAAPTDVEALQLNDTEFRVLHSINGVSDVAALAAQNGLTVFDTSRVLYSMSALNVVQTGDLGKIRLRRVFREVAELLCRSTIAWCFSPTDTACEEEVNQLSEDLPLCLINGRIQDQADPALKIDELAQLYRGFLTTQLDVISRRFGSENARQSFQRVCRQLAPELQEVSREYGLDQLVCD